MPPLVLKLRCSCGMKRRSNCAHTGRMQQQGAERTPNALLEPHSPEFSTTWVGCNAPTTFLSACTRSACETA